MNTVPSFSQHPQKKRPGLWGTGFSEKNMRCPCRSPQTALFSKMTFGVLSGAMPACRYQIGQKQHGGKAALGKGCLVTQRIWATWSPPLEAPGCACRYGGLMALHTGKLPDAVTSTPTPSAHQSGPDKWTSFLSGKAWLSP